MATSTPGQTPAARQAFNALIARYSDCEDDADRIVLRDQIWETFGARGVAFISDMASFSSLSRQLGVCHFLKLIHRAHKVIGPLVAEHGGTLLKCDADNCYAFFVSADDALRASIEINAAFFRANQKLPLHDHIYLSIGIDYGDVLLIGREDFYGDPVNTASKLGEDLAIRGETLVTERAIAQTAYVPPETVERMVARVSEIEISYLRFPMMTAASAVAGRSPA